MCIHGEDSVAVRRGRVNDRREKKKKRIILIVLLNKVLFQPKRKLILVLQ